MVSVPGIRQGVGAVEEDGDQTKGGRDGDGTERKRGGRGIEEGNKTKWKRAREEKGKEDVDRLIEGEEGDKGKGTNRRRKTK